VSTRGTLALLVVAAGLAAWVFLVERPRERELEEAESAGALVLEIEPDTVTALELRLEDSERTARVARVEGSDTWRLESPIEYPADQGAVEDLIDLLAKLEAEAVIDDPPEDLSPFGLGDARVPVRFWTGGAEPRVLWLGGKAPIGSSRYALAGSDPPRLVTVEDWRAGRLRPTLQQLRDKRITRLDPGGVDALTVRRDGRLIVRAERGGEDDWSLTEPEAHEADGDRVQRLLQDVSFARAIGFLDPPVDLDAHGLDAPDVELELRSGESTETIRLAKKGEKAFAQVAGRDLAFEIPLRILGQVPSDRFAYRYKRVLRLDDGAVRRLELEFPRDGESHAFVRGDGEWRPEAAGIEVDSFRIEDILFAIRHVEATGVIEGQPERALHALEPPRVRVTARDSDGNELGWLDLGDPEPRAGTVARSSQSGALWRVANDIGEDVPLGLEAFRNNWLREPPSAAPEAAER
jgi:hypothetical protein